MPRVIQFSEFGGPEVLRFHEVETPSPKDNELVIEVRAIGLNQSDAMMRSGILGGGVTLPSRLGHDAAGIVTAVGKNIAHVRVGDAVDTLPAFSPSEYGVYGEVALVPGHAVVKQPAGLTFEEGASIWTMFLTAYDALIGDADLQPGEPVLITAASSSVGLAAIQLANLVGAVPIALTRTSEKRQKLLDAGAKVVVPYDEVDLHEEVMNITGQKGVRIAFDPVGGELLPRLMGLMPWQGTLYLYGALGGASTTIPVVDAILQKLTIKAWTLGGRLGDPVALKSAVEFLSAALEQNKLTPCVDRIFAFDEIVESHRYLESGRQFGKIVVSVG